MITERDITCNGNVIVTKNAYFEQTAPSKMARLIHAKDVVKYTL